MHEIDGTKQLGQQRVKLRQKWREGLNSAKLLVVDDEPINVLLLRDILQHAGYTTIASTSDPLEALPLYRSFAPDIVLLDLMMPGIDGVEVMEQMLAEGGERDEIPILMLTADVSFGSKRRALMAGAHDYLTKPFDTLEIVIRIANLLQTRFLQMELRDKNDELEIRVQERTAQVEAAKERIALYANQLEHAQVETLDRLARAGEFRDDDTGQHTLRVSVMTATLGDALGYPTEHKKWLQQAARLHDVGKIGISDSILLKPGKLTPEEFETVKTHTIIGAELLRGGATELFRIAHRIALSHHERWDGGGYPYGVSGDSIPFEARLLAVADVFDALTHSRPYKDAWPVQEALLEIESQRGRQFDPAVVDAFLRVVSTGSL
ncbi:MAG TPA: HD domain-containing phosphohydrolase [Capsulimonadaceae bacterium]|jgi:putative two-component system response regulator